jgi:hypothetical protein
MQVLAAGGSSSAVSLHNKLKLWPRDVARCKRNIMAALNISSTKQCDVSRVSTHYSYVLGSTQHPTQFDSSGVKKPEREADHLRLSMSINVKNAWNYTSTSTCVHVAAVN